MTEELTCKLPKDERQDILSSDYTGDSSDDEEASDCEATGASNRSASEFIKNGESPKSTDAKTAKELKRERRRERRRKKREKALEQEKKRSPKSTKDSPAATGVNRSESAKTATLPQAGLNTVVVSSGMAQTPIPAPRVIPTVPVSNVQIPDPRQGTMMPYVLYPLDGLPPPFMPHSTIGQVPFGPGARAPPMFAGREPALRTDASQPCTPGQGGSWHTELVHLDGDRVGVSVSGLSSEDIVRHEMDLCQVGLNTKRLPYMDLRLSNDYKVTSPRSDKPYKLSISYTTKLGTPACPVIAHELEGPMSLNQLGSMLASTSTLISKSKSYLLDHIVKTRHPIMGKGIQAEDIYVNITAFAWQGHMQRKFPSGIPYVCLTKEVAIANAPLEDGYFTLSLICSANTHKQCRDFALPKAPTTPPTTTAPSKKENGKVNDVSQSGNGKGARAKESPSKPNDLRATLQREEERQRESNRRRDSDREADRQRKRSSSQKRKQSSERGSKRSASPMKKVDSVVHKVVANGKDEQTKPGSSGQSSPPLPSPKVGQHPLSTQRDALLYFKSW